MYKSDSVNALQKGLPGSFLMQRVSSGCLKFVRGVWQICMKEAVCLVSKQSSAGAFSAWKFAI